MARLSSLALLCMGVYHVTTISSEDAKTPNIMFILMDDVGFADVGFRQPNWNDFGVNDDEYASERYFSTENIDRLALKEGLILDRHYVHPTCTATRGALLTGRYPFDPKNSMTIAVNFFDDISLNIPDEIGPELLFPYVLSKYGDYKTMMTGKWHLGRDKWSESPITYFDESLFSLSPYVDFYKHACCVDPSAFPLEMPEFETMATETPPLAAALYKKYPMIASQGLCLYDLWKDDKTEYDDRETYNDDVYIEDIYNENIESFLKDNYGNKRHKSKDPFFIYYAPNLVHSPLQIPPNHNGINFDVCNTIKNDGRNVFCQMMQYFDWRIGKLEKLLKKLKLWDNTLIVISSDNGAFPANIPNDRRQLSYVNAFGTSLPLRGTKYTDFEGGIRTPAFITGGYLPSNLKGKRLNHLIGVEDWYATFLSLANIDFRDTLIDKNDLDSYNIWPIIEKLSKSMSNSKNYDSSDSSDDDKYESESEEFNEYNDIRHEWVDIQAGAGACIIRNDGYKFILDGKTGPFVLTSPIIFSRNYLEFDGAESKLYQSSRIAEYEAEMLFNVYNDEYEQNNIIYNSRYENIVNDLRDELYDYLEDAYFKKKGPDRLAALKATIDYNAFCAWKDDNQYSYVDEEYVRRVYWDLLLL